MLTKNRGQKDAKVGCSIEWIEHAKDCKENMKKNIAKFLLSKGLSEKRENLYLRYGL